jgi:hypothetical protein
MLALRCRGHFNDSDVREAAKLTLHDLIQQPGVIAQKRVALPFLVDCYLRCYLSSQASLLKLGKWLI